MNYPIISIAIATLNSEKTLFNTLKSIKKQTYPQNKIEVLVIDGGSVDKTIYIAKKFHCKILSNPKIELIFAKHIGFLQASGKYLMFLDSDEVLESPQSLKLKYKAFKKNDLIKAVMPSGYKTPKGFSSINHYINEFGDPFTYFIYNESKSYKYLIEDWFNKYKKVYEDKNLIIFDFSKIYPLPLVELWAGGCMIDLQYSRLSFLQIKKHPSLIAHLFYLLKDNNTLLGITKNDNTIHCSSDSLSKYLKKLSSRIKNNVYRTAMGEGGFSGREKFQPPWFHLKKFLFIPYCLSIIFPLTDSIYLSISRKKIIYLLHLSLCAYTSFFITYYYFLKLINIKPKIKTYGN